MHRAAWTSGVTCLEEVHILHNSRLIPCSWIRQHTLHFKKHCTMGLSIEIEDFQVLKSKCLVSAQFWSKSDNSFFDWCKTVNILVEKYFPHKYDDKYGIFYKKPNGLECETWNFSWRHKRPGVKKHLKIIFFTVQPFIVKMQFEICKYFLLFFFL